MLSAQKIHIYFMVFGNCFNWRLETTIEIYSKTIKKVHKPVPFEILF